MYEGNTQVKQKTKEILKVRLAVKLIKELYNKHMTQTRIQQRNQ